MSTSGGLSPDWTNRPYQPEDLWAYRPLGNHLPPDAKRHPIDAFLARALRRAGLAPAPAADRAALVRRVTLDLTGLPPTSDEIQAFLDDKSADAYERLVDRLLASPRYAEQQARHWLDIALRRYGLETSNVPMPGVCDYGCSFVTRTIASCRTGAGDDSR